MIGFLIENGNDQQMTNSVNTLTKDTKCIVFSASLVPNYKLM